MYKNIILIGVLLFLSNCNQHSNINQHNLNKRITMSLHFSLITTAPLKEERRLLEEVQ